MANDRTEDYPNPRDRDAEPYGRDYNPGRDGRNFRGGGTGYGDGRADDGRPDSTGGRENYGSGRDYYGGSSDYPSGGSGQQRPGADQNHGGYGSDNRSTQAGERGWNQSQNQGRDRDYREGGNRDYGRAPQGYDYQDRGFMARAGDEVRSWFGDEDAERRRDRDQRHDERAGGSTAYGRDDHYHDWRKSQIEAFDRDYHEYRQENAKKFESEFGAWRSARQTQRQSLGQVRENMDVVGSDGGHIGTVDKVRGDRIILSKNDSDAGGRHHSIPSSWIQSVDDNVTVVKSADEAHKHWRDEEGSGAMFGAGDGPQDGETKNGDSGVNLNRSFSGTY